MARNTPRSSSTKKSTGRASPAKKSSTSRTVSRKSPPSRSSANESSSDEASDDSSARKAASDATSSNRDSEGRSSSGRSAPKATARPPARASQVAAHAALELLELTGRQAEGVTGLQKTDDGWTVQVEVVEVHRIPDTTDVLALYEVETDNQGSMLGYRRLRRYARGTPGDD